MDLITTSSRSIVDTQRRQVDVGIVFLFAASGASGLMLEVVWSRMLGWLSGATTWSIMTVLVAFMGGLGLGAILWGRLAGRCQRPFRLFGLMEMAIGLYSLAVPFLFDGLGELFVACTRVVGESPAGGIAVRVVTAVLALGPPTLLMGGTLPVLTRFAAAGRWLPGRTAGTLYAANTAGAVVGCCLTGCVLILWLGVVETKVMLRGPCWKSLPRSKAGMSCSKRDRNTEAHCEQFDFVVYPSPTQHKKCCSRAWD